MIKIDTILKSAGVAVIVALGIPVGLSVKFSDGQIKAEELQEEFGIATWTLGVRSPKEFSSLKVELFRAQSEGTGERTSLGSSTASFSNGVKKAEVRIYANDKGAYIFCEGNRSELLFPFDVAASVAHNPGGKGSEIGSGEFLLAEGKEANLVAAITVD